MLPHERRYRASIRKTPLTREEWDALVVANAAPADNAPTVRARRPAVHIRLEPVLQHARDLADRMGPQVRRKLNAPAAVLYLVAADSAPGVVKIGITSNLAKRVRAITTASGMHCSAVAAWQAGEDVVRRVEDHAKRALRGRQTHGEWFRAPVDAFVRYIGKMMKGHGERVV